MTEFVNHAMYMHAKTEPFQKMKKVSIIVDSYVQKSVKYKKIINISKYNYLHFIKLNSILFKII